MAFKKGWRKANPATQKRLLRKLVASLVYSKDGLETKYVMVKENVENVLKKGLNGASEVVSEAYLKARKNLNSLWEETCDILPINGASVVGNGRAVPTTDASIKSIAKYHDFIRFIPKNKENIYLKCSPLYEDGLSLNEIVRQTGFAKSSIRNALTSTGLPLRKNKSTKKLEIKRQIVVKGGRIPYGHAYLEGQLLIDPKEYKNVLDIYRLWKKAQSYRAIARNLNDRKITTRAGKKWTNEIIKRIIDRHESDLKKTKTKMRKTK